MTESFNTPQPTLIHLIRHGEPKGGEKFRGHQNDPLSPKGWQQMRHAIGRYNQWQEVISSPLLRCKSFAQEVASNIHAPLSLKEAFKEISFGDWEGKKAAEIDNKELSQFWSDPIKYPAPNGELLIDFQQRVITEWQQLIAAWRIQSLHPQNQSNHSPHSTINNHRRLIVTHGGTIRILIAHILHIPLSNIFNLQIPYAGISKIIIYHHPNRSYENVGFINGSLA